MTHIAPTPTPAADMKARWKPTDEQITVAVAIMWPTTYDLVLVPLALPGKVHGIWQTGQVVEAVNGFWPVRRAARDRTEPMSYGAGRDAAEAAAMTALNGRPGQPCFAVISPDGTWAVFEGYGVE